MSKKDIAIIAALRQKLEARTDMHKLAKRNTREAIEQMKSMTVKNAKLRAQCKAFRETMVSVRKYIDAQESVSSVAISNSISQVLLKNPEL